MRPAVAVRCGAVNSVCPVSGSYSPIDGVSSRIRSSVGGVSSRIRSSVDGVSSRIRSSVGGVGSRIRSSVGAAAQDPSGRRDRSFPSARFTREHPFPTDDQLSRNVTGSGSSRTRRPPLDPSIDPPTLDRRHRLGPRTLNPRRERVHRRPMPGPTPLSGVNRRRSLALLATGCTTALGLAGCLGRDGPGTATASPTTTGSTDTPSPTPSPSPSSTPTPPGPVTLDVGESRAGLRVATPRVRKPILDGRDGHTGRSGWPRPTSPGDPGGDGTAFYFFEERIPPFTAVFYPQVDAAPAGRFGGSRDD